MTAKSPTLDDVRSLLREPPNSSQKSKLPPPGKLFEGRRFAAFSSDSSFDQKLDNVAKRTEELCKQMEVRIEETDKLSEQIASSIKKGDELLKDIEKGNISYTPVYPKLLEPPVTPSPMPIPPSETAAVQEVIQKPSSWSQVRSILWKVLVVIAVVAVAILGILALVL